MPVEITRFMTEAEADSGAWNSLFDTTQGHILEKHRRTHVWNIFLRFDVGSRAGQILASVPRLASVSDLRAEKKKMPKTPDALAEMPPRPVVSFLGLSSSGTDKLGINNKDFGSAFVQGFAERVNNTSRMSKESFLGPWNQHSSPETRIDALLIGTADTPELLQSWFTTLHALFDDAVTILWVEQGAVKRDPKGPDGRRGPTREHFNFVDGLSQPLLDGVDSNPTSPLVSGFNPRFTISNVLVQDVLDRDCFGSFLAYVRIEQHVEAFDNAVATLAGSIHPPTGVTADDQAKALIVGRYQDGTPLIQSPLRTGQNDFVRGDDKLAEKWPFPSHICKMNARTKELGDRRPIVRRGVTYEDGNEKGLLFQSFQASLDGQFEVLFSTWAGDVHHPSINVGGDPILTNLTVPQAYPGTNGNGPICIGGLTTVHGGEYFYFPSIPGIAKLGGNNVINRPATTTEPSPVTPES